MRWGLRDTKCQSFGSFGVCVRNSDSLGDNLTLAVVITVYPKSHFARQRYGVGDSGRDGETGEEAGRGGAAKFRFPDGSISTVFAFSPG